METATLSYVLAGVAAVVAAFVAFRAKMRREENADFNQRLNELERIKRLGDPDRPPDAKPDSDPPKTDRIRRVVQEQLSQSGAHSAIATVQDIDERVSRALDGTKADIHELRQHVDVRLDNQDRAVREIRDMVFELRGARIK